jgi:hypothetical protein
MGTVAQRLESELLKYPGMQADETLVWRTWAAIHQAEYDRFDHNIRLGQGVDPGPAYLPAVRRAAILNSQLRLDSVGWKGIDNSLLPGKITSPQQVYDLFPSAEAEIMEVKRRATSSAIGEVSTHFHLWVQEFPDAPHPALRIICAGYATPIVAAAQANNIVLDVVQVNFSMLSNASGS